MRSSFQNRLWTRRTWVVDRGVQTGEIQFRYGPDGAARPKFCPNYELGRTGTPCSRPRSVWSIPVLGRGLHPGRKRGEHTCVGLFGNSGYNDAITCDNDEEWSCEGDETGVDDVSNEPMGVYDPHQTLQFPVC